jgi:hypothetical protein
LETAAAFKTKKIGEEAEFVSRMPDTDKVDEALMQWSIDDINSSLDDILRFQCLEPCKRTPIITTRKM